MVSYDTISYGQGDEVVEIPLDEPVVVGAKEDIDSMSVDYVLEEVDKLAMNADNAYLALFSNEYKNDTGRSELVMLQRRLAEMQSTLRGDDEYKMDEIMAQLTFVDDALRLIWKGKFKELLSLDIATALGMYQDDSCHFESYYYEDEYEDAYDLLEEAYHYY